MALGALDHISTSRIPVKSWIFGAVGARGMIGLRRSESASGSPFGLPATFASCKDGKSRGGRLGSGRSEVDINLISGRGEAARSRKASAEFGPCGTECGGACEM